MGEKILCNKQATRDVSPATLLRYNAIEKFQAGLKNPQRGKIELAGAWGWVKLDYKWKRGGFTYLSPQPSLPADGFSFLLVPFAQPQLCLAEVSHCSGLLWCNSVIKMDGSWAWEFQPWLPSNLRYLTSERLCSYEENSHRALQTFLKDAVSCSGLPGTYYTDSQINSYSPFSSMTLSHRACPHIIVSVNPTERSFNQYTELRNNLPRPQGFPAKVRLLPQVAMFMQIRHCSLCVEWTACSQCEPSTRYTVVLSQQQTLSHLSLPPA